DVPDFVRVDLGQAPAEDSKVLREDIDEPPVDAAVAGHDAVARHLLLGHAEVETAVLAEPVQLFEGVGIEQDLDALARGELAFAVLPLLTLETAAQGRPLQP